MEELRELTWRGYVGAVVATLLGVIAVKGVKGTLLGVLEIYKAA